jgi:signal transduction histidine kinase
MLRKIPWWITEPAVALAVAVVTIGDAVHQGGRLWLTVPLTIAGSIALLLRRRYTLQVLALETALAAVLVSTGHFWLVVAVVVVIWTAASKLERRVSLRASGISVAVLAVPAFFQSEWRHVFPQTAFFAAAWLWGDARRTAELEREAGARQAAADERNRIARELHDVITHNVSVMVVQAAAANDVFDARPERAREALHAIEDTGRQALGELRRLLDVEGGGDGTLPQPGLARVDELVANVRAAGLPVALEIEGHRSALPDGIDLSAYRILQEALTNTLKHARATKARVRVRYAADAVELEVTDDGVGGSVGNGGHGIVGMRERVALFGGRLDAGSQPEGGFAVRARMPLGTS